MIADGDKAVRIDQMRKDDYRSLFKQSEQGEAVLRDLMGVTHFFTPTVDFGNAKDNAAADRQAAFNEGKRWVMLYILSQLDKRWDNVDTLMEDATPPYHESLMEDYRNE